MSNFKDTELWQNARSLVREAYRVTQSWPDDAGNRGLTAEVRAAARGIAKMVPGALLKKSGPGGRAMWTYSMDNFTDLEVVCALAEDLDYTDEAATKALLEMSELVRVELKALGKEASEIARRKQSKMFGMEMFGDDDEDE